MHVCARVAKRSHKRWSGRTSTCSLSYIILGTMCYILSNLRGSRCIGTPRAPLGRARIGLALSNPNILSHVQHPTTRGAILETIPQNVANFDSTGGILYTMGSTTLVFRRCFLGGDELGGCLSSNSVNDFSDPRSSSRSCWKFGDFV